jgi:hypothetical protein
MKKTKKPVLLIDLQIIRALLDRLFSNPVLLNDLYEHSAE